MRLLKFYLGRILTLHLEIGRYIKISLVTIFLVAILATITSDFVVRVEGKTSRNIRDRNYTYMGTIRELDGNISQYRREIKALKGNIIDLNALITTKDLEVSSLKEDLEILTGSGLINGSW